MRVVYEEQTCDHHGQCAIACPEVFELVSPTELRFVAEPDESLRDDVEAAVDACPTMSLRVEG